VAVAGGIALIEDLSDPRLTPGENDQGPLASICPVQFAQDSFPGNFAYFFRSNSLESKLLNTPRRYLGHKNGVVFVQSDLVWIEVTAFTWIGPG